MPKERVFDQEVIVSMNTGGEACSSATVQKRLMLRIERSSDTNETHKHFTVELYDENSVDFLYSGKFTRTKFEDIKRTQRLKFTMDQAPRNIINFVQRLREDKNRFVNCTMIGSPTTQVPGVMGEQSPSICRFELMCRSEFKEMSEFTLELERVQGDQLNQHLIQFIEKYKRKADDAAGLREQLEGLQIEYNKQRDQSKHREEELRGKIGEQEEQIDELLGELREKGEELKSNESDLEVQRSNLKTLKVAYQKILAEYERVIADNERFVAELDECDAAIGQMQSQLKEAIDARDHLERDYRAKQAQVRKGRSYIEQLKKALSESEVEIANLHRRIKATKMQRESPK